MGVGARHLSPVDSKASQSPTGQNEAVSSGEWPCWKKYRGSLGSGGKKVGREVSAEVSKCLSKCELFIKPSGGGNETSVMPQWRIYQLSDIAVTDMPSISSILRLSPTVSLPTPRPICSNLTKNVFRAYTTRMSPLTLASTIKVRKHLKLRAGLSSA